MSCQLPQAVCQYIRRDSFVGLQELLVAPEPPQHHVADDQQRPAIAQYLHGGIQRTPRPPLGTRLLLWHISTLAYFHLHFTSKIGTLPFTLQRTSVRELQKGQRHNASMKVLAPVLAVFFAK